MKQSEWKMTEYGMEIKSSSGPVKHKGDKKRKERLKNCNVGEKYDNLFH